MSSKPYNPAISCFRFGPYNTSDSPGEGRDPCFRRHATTRSRQSGFLRVRQSRGEELWAGLTSSCPVGKVMRKPRHSSSPYEYSTVPINCSPIVYLSVAAIGVYERGCRWTTNATTRCQSRPCPNHHSSCAVKAHAEHFHSHW